MSISRRLFLASLGGLSMGSPWGASALGQTSADDHPIAPALLERALQALERHSVRIPHRDHIGVIDFSLPSRTPRFHVVALDDFSVRSHLVAHGAGSDPRHTGWLQRFSNEPHSNATASGTYRTAAVYVGAHGPSLRLEGLDATNDNAYSRAIVVHGAWYVSETMVEQHGVIGRSQGCFAVANASLPSVMASLSPGHLIYADQA